MGNNYKKQTIKKALETFDELARTETTRSSSIFTIPRNLLTVRENAFYPEVFSFGPLHYSKEDIDYYNLKKQHLQGLFEGKFRETKRSKTQECIECQPRNRISLEKVLKAMFDLLERIKKCYYQETGYKDEVTINIMAEDGCFIVEFLRVFSNKSKTDDKEKERGADGSSSDYPIFVARRLLPSLLRDLIKFENQLPLFVLDKLFSMTTSGNDETSLHDLLVNFFRSMFSLDESIYKLDPSPNYAHPLDLFRSLFVSHMIKKPKGNETYEITMVDLFRLLCISSRRKKPEGNGADKIPNQKMIYSAHGLQEAGVSIRKKEDSHLLDISFDRNERVLQIPPFSFDENMIVLLLNFVAYEQCDQSQKPFFTNYILFLDSLINTTKDVKILGNEGIILYPPGTESEVVNLFNKFYKDMGSSLDQRYLSVDMDAINKYCEGFCKDECRFWLGNLIRQRFSSPWTFLSLVAAIVLLILTMLQTFFTIFPYYHPN